MPDLSYAAYLKAKAAKAAEVSDAAQGGIAGSVAPSSDNPIFSGEGPKPEDVIFDANFPGAREPSEAEKIRRIMAGEAPDNIKPQEIRETTGVRRALDDVAKGTGPLDPRRALTPLYEGARAAGTVGSKMVLEPALNIAFKALNGDRGFDPGAAGMAGKMGYNLENPGDEQIAQQLSAKRTQTPRELATDALTLASNAAFGPATTGAESLLAGEGLAGAGARTAASAAGAGAVMGTQGAAEGAMAPAKDLLERTQNLLTGGIEGAKVGLLTGGVLHAGLSEALPWAARGMTETAKLAGTTAIELAQDASLSPAKFRENRDYRKIFGGLDQDLDLGLQAPKVAPPELEPRRIDSAQDIRNTDLDRFPLSPGERARVLRLAAASASAPKQGPLTLDQQEARSRRSGYLSEPPASAEGESSLSDAVTRKLEEEETSDELKKRIGGGLGNPESSPYGDLSSVRPWPKGSVKTSDIFTPGNLARFDRMKSSGLEGDPELRRRIASGEDLTDAEVHRAEPNNLTVYDILKVPHPTKPGTTIGAEVKRSRIRGQAMDPARHEVESLSDVQDPDQVIAGLERTRSAKGGNEFGDVADVISKVKADKEAGIPLTLGRLRVHQRDAMLEHGQQIAKDHGIELRNDGVVVILAGPPGSGKSTIANQIGKKLGAYQVDADFAKTRDPRYQDIGAPGVHEESSEVALRAQALAISRRNNVVLPMIGKDAGKLQRMMEELKASGHTVYYVLSDLTPEESSVRAFNRGLGKGRNVPPDYVLNSVGRKSHAAFDSLKGNDDLLGGRTLRLNQAHPSSVPLSDRVIEHGAGFDPNILQNETAGTAGEGGRRPRLDNGHSGTEESAPEGGADRGLSRTDPATDLGSDVPVTGRPAAPKPWSIHEVPTADLHLDPDRFQWKQDVQAGTGAGANLRGSKRYNPQLGGVIDVWRDPSDGKDYIVNGHHRFNLAKRDGVGSLNVRYIDAPDARAARTWGAVRNIASGKGTALDVAKFLRDSGETISGLEDRGVDLKVGLAREGVAIAKLPADLINRLHQDPTLIRKAAIVGENLGSADQQRAAFAEMGKLTERQTEELTRVIRAAGSESVDQENLFGTESVAKSLFVEKAKVASAIRDRLSKDKRLFGYVANEGRAAELERGGNKISVAKSREIARKSAQLEELFDRLYSRGGPIGEIMDAAAKRVAKGAKPAAVASEIYQEIQAAVQKEIPSARAGKVSGTNEAGGAMLGGLGGAPIGSAAGGAIGSQIGSTDEERRRNARAGAALGFAAGAGAGGLAGKAAFRNVEPALETIAKGAGRASELVAGSREAEVPSRAAVFDIRPTGKRLEIKIKGPPSPDQLNTLLTKIRENPGALRYSLRDNSGRSVGTGSTLTDLFSDLTFSGSNRPLTNRIGTGAVGDQPDMFGHVEKPASAQGALFGDEPAGRSEPQSAASKLSGSSFSEKQVEARANADFLRKQMNRMRPGPARSRVAVQVAELDRVAGFNTDISREEMRTRAIAGRPGAVGDQPESELENIIAKHEQQGVELYVSEKRNVPGVLALDKIKVDKSARGEGLGSNALKDLLDYADRNGKTVALDVSAESGFKGRLEKWYKDNGFIRNKGRRPEISESWIREPEPPERVIAAAHRAPDGTVFSGAHHGDTYHQALEAGKINDREYDVSGEGFLTNRNRFVSREEGYDIADAQDQIKEKYQDDPMLEWGKLAAEELKGSRGRGLTKKALRNRTGAIGDQPLPSLEDRTVDQHAKELARTGQLRESRNLLNFMRGSKVRQALFHGTEIPKEEFHAPHAHDIGIHLGTADVATERLYNRGSFHPKGEPGAQVVPVFAKIRNPLRVKDQGSWYAEDMYGALEATGKFSDSELRRLKTEIDRNNSMTPDNVIVREFLQRKGYDSLVYRNTGEIPGQWAESDHYIPDPARPEKLGPAGAGRHDLNGTDSYVVFDPKQLKSATGNSGEFDPATRRLSGAIGDQPDRGAYAGESDLLNVQKIVEGSSAQERVADQVEKYRALRNENRTTWEDADKQKSKVVQELLAGDRKAARPHIARKLTGVQLLARRDVVRQNDAMIEDLSKQLAGGKLTLEEHNTASDLLSKAIAHNDALLSDLVIGSSQKGRDLNLLKRMSTKTLDHDVWQIQAKRMLGERPLDDATAAQLRRLVNDAKEACGG